jgi:hypothetical protein
MVQVSSLVQFLIVVLAAWLARQQERFIEYLKFVTCSKSRS